MTTAPCLRWRKIETGIKVGRHSVEFICPLDGFIVLGTAESAS